ncbi:aromatic amino acid transport family protein [Bifidobacterium sp. ESL0763]|uniref:aromatic amino acid transport family protein n=1 Tax=Bifidobacterium sp. ESL0763 TaxID=2983227 RepID=UPI0023F65E8E|nr:aromatic amino acid transport family protein [Bifidobacterium sp. ESL0763]MDF7663487.1 aromatic amino acid transport family protein [Bifidobacterium sp. ESL0763]
MSWHGQDVRWMLSLFGTAIGAGVLFLPIDVGGVGTLGLLLTIVIALPLAYYSHRAMCRFVLSARNPGDDITDAVEQHFGFGFGMVFTLIYFAQTFVLLMVYSISITNTAESFIVNQLHMPAPSRGLLSLVLVGVLILIVTCGTTVVTRVMSWMTWPVIAVLALFGLYLIPRWNPAMLTSYPRGTGGGLDLGSLALNLWLLIPVIVLTFDHSAIVSSFTVNARLEYGAEYAERKIVKILGVGEPMMVAVVLFFVVSSDLALDPARLAMAKAENVSILSYLANVLNSPAISWVAALTSFFCIFKAFLGHYLGTEEGLGGIIRKVAETRHRVIPRKALRAAVNAIMFFACWLIAWANPSVIGMLETMAGPLIAFVLMLLPTYAIHRVPALRKYSGKASNVFVFVVGLVAVSAIVYNIVELFV